MSRHVRDSLNAELAADEAAEARKERRALVQEIESSDEQIDPDGIVWIDSPRVETRREGDRVIAESVCLPQEVWAVYSEYAGELVQCAVDECESYVPEDLPPTDEDRCPSCSDAECSGYVIGSEKRGGPQ